MKNDIYLLLACFAVSICALAWVGWGLHDANGEIAHLHALNKQSDSLSLSTIASLQSKLADCQRGTYEEKVDSLPAPEPKPVVKPKKKKKSIHHAPRRRYTKKRHAEKSYEYHLPQDNRAPPKSNNWTHSWGQWGFWGL